MKNNDRYNEIRRVVNTKQDDMTPDENHLLDTLGTMSSYLELDEAVDRLLTSDV